MGGGTNGTVRARIWRLRRGEPGVRHRALRSMPMRRFACSSLLLLVPALSLDAQREPRRGAPAFAAETLGGTAGSMAGVGVGLLITRAVEECESEDLVCDLRRVATTGVASVVGA